MKSLIVLCGILLLSTSCLAQGAYSQSFQKGTVELNFFLDAGKLTTTYEYSNSLGSNSDGRTYFNFSVTPGFFIADGFSIEPEIGFLAVERLEPALAIIPNLSYTYLLPESRVALYARAGYGLTNSTSYFGALVKQSEKMDIGILNVGAGTKYLITDGVIFRVEINYKRLSQEEDMNYVGYSNSVKRTLENTRVLFGLSVLL